jgi:hypothetical protein
MHDKMDYGKTASLKFLHKTKQLDGLMKLLVSITSMLAHGHGDVRYVHYSLDLVGLFSKLLQDLDKPSNSCSRQLFDGSRLSPLFEVC